VLTVRDDELSVGDEDRHVREKHARKNMRKNM